MLKLCIKKVYKKLLNTTVTILKFKIEYIEDVDYQNIESLKSKFEKLRIQSNYFGDMSLKFHNKQIICLILSSIIYGLLVLLK